MIITPEQLEELLPGNRYTKQWADALNNVLPEYDIDTPLRVAAFIAQCAHESANFTQLEENLNYRWQTLRKVFGKYFTSDTMAKSYANRSDKKEAIASLVYANRMGNGPPETGDGYRFRGRGLIQLTGRENYSYFAESMEISLDEAVAYMETFEGAVQSACWFWDTNDLNPIADRGDIKTLTKRINGGYNGLADRIEKYNEALEVFQ